MEQTILNAAGVEKRYKTFTLKPTDLAVPGGCIVGLIGENGAGKSTLIKSLLNIARRDGGTVEVFGKDLDSREREIKEDIGVVFGDQYFPMNFRARDAARVMAGIYRNWDQTQFEAYLERFRLDGGQPIKAYSRGMRMKLTLALAMSHHARLLILDEPASGLDPVVREELLELLEDFVGDEEHGVLVSSHIISDLEKVSDYVALLHRGEMLLFEEKDALLESFALLKCGAGEAEKLPSESVIGMREGTFGAEILMRRENLPKGAVWEPASLEQRLIYHVKEGK